MQKIKEAKVLQVLSLKKQGLNSNDIIKILGYSRTTVKAIYSGNCEISFPVVLKDSMDWIGKQGYEFQNYDKPIESVEDSYIRKEGAGQLYDTLDTLSDRDKEIIQAKADGQSDRQIITEYNTSAGHIKKIQEKLQGVLDFS